MKRLVLLLAVTAALGACRDYKFYPRLSNQDGLVPPDSFAMYGPEQAEAIAIARAMGAKAGNSRQSQVAAINNAMDYGRTLPDVVQMTPDTLGYRMTIQFRSGWRTMVNPVADGKDPSATPNLPARTASR